MRSAAIRLADTHIVTTTLHYATEVTNETNGRSLLFMRLFHASTTSYSSKVFLLETGLVKFGVPFYQVHARSGKEAWSARHVPLFLTQ